MYKLGLTGNIGCGKSSVSEILEENGFAIVDADKIARGIYNYDDIMLEMKKNFPSAIVNNTVDRAILANIVFSDRKKLNLLNEITHKKIRSLMEEEINYYEKNDVKVVVLDVPLLFEAGFDKMADFIVVVICDLEEQINRIIKRDGIKREDAINRINSQMSQEEKMKRADFVIDNSKNKDELKKNVIKFIDEFDKNKNKW